MAVRFTHVSFPSALGESQVEDSAQMEGKNWGKKRKRREREGTGNVIKGPWMRYSCGADH